MLPTITRFCRSLITLTHPLAFKAQKYTYTYCSGISITCVSDPHYCSFKADPDPFSVKADPDPFSVKADPDPGFAKNFRILLVLFQSSIF